MSTPSNLAENLNQLKRDGFLLIRQALDLTLKDVQIQGLA